MRRGLQLMIVAVLLCLLNALVTVANLVSEVEFLQRLIALGGLTRAAAGAAGMAGSMLCLLAPHEARARSAAAASAAFFLLALVLGAWELEGRWPDLLLLGGLAIFLWFVHQLAVYLDRADLARTVFLTLAFPVWGVVAMIGAIPMALVFGPPAILGPIVAMGLFVLGAGRYARSLHLLAAAASGRLVQGTAIIPLTQI